MATAIKPKRTSTPGAVPTIAQLQDGEFATNVADGRAFVRAGSIVREIGGVVDAVTSAEARAPTASAVHAELARRATPQAVAHGDTIAVDGRAVRLDTSTAPAPRTIDGVTARFATLALPDGTEINETVEIFLIGNYLPHFTGSIAGEDEAIGTVPRARYLFSWSGSTWDWSGAVAAPEVISARHRARAGEDQVLRYGDLDFDNGPGLKALCEAGYPEVVVRGPIAISPTTISLSAPLRLVFEGTGSVVVPYGSGTYPTSTLLRFTTDEDLHVEAVGWIDGQDRLPIGLSVRPASGAAANARYPTWRTDVGVRNVRRFASDPGDCMGIEMRGPAYISLGHSRVHNVTREAGGGVPLSQGCHAMTISGSGGRWPRSRGPMWESGCEVFNVSCEDADGSDGNIDCDGIRIFMEGGGQQGRAEHPEEQIVGRGGDFRNIQGRITKTQSRHVDIADVRVRYDGDCRQIKRGWRLFGIQQSAFARIANVDMYFDGTTNPDLVGASAGATPTYATGAHVVSLYQNVDLGRPLGDLDLDGLRITGKNLTAAPGFDAVVWIDGGSNIDQTPGRATVRNVRVHGAPTRVFAVGPKYSPLDIAFRDVEVDALAEHFIENRRHYSADVYEQTLDLENIRHRGPPVRFASGASTDPGPRVTHRNVRGLTGLV